MLTCQFVYLYLERGGAFDISGLLILFYIGFPQLRMRELGLSNIEW